MGVFSANTGATSGLINSINIKAIVVIDMKHLLLIILLSLRYLKNMLLITSLKVYLF